MYDIRFGLRMDFWELLENDTQLPYADFFTDLLI